MCRLFGFRSLIPSQVHRSLVTAENALQVQSQLHPDGWGLAYYLAGHPHVIKSPGSATTDHLFRRVSGVVASETVVAHVRKATQGNISIVNCHPFQYGKWVLAHNGNIAHFAEVREALLHEVAPLLRRFILGDTDSEVLFYLFLTQLGRRVELHRPGTPVKDVVSALQETVDLVRERVDVPYGGDPSLLTLMVTDGSAMAAVREGKELYRSTHKSRCGDRDACPHLQPECEGPSASGYTTHFILSSEPLLGENVWEPLHEGEATGVDFHMRIQRFPVAV
jgi:glutamine amidotransferase